MTQIYEQLTGINIEQEKAIWDDRGKGYYGEYLVLCELYKRLPGTCKILMNLNIPVNATKTTEIDLLLIHETGLYVFEIKHYKGTIYGKDDDENWTQYFRTAKNNVFRNPINQNAYHMRALQALFPDVPIRSVVVFTGDECVIKVNNKNDLIDICTINNLVDVLHTRFSNCPQKLSIAETDKLFSDIMKYSPMKKQVAIGERSAPFHLWLEPVISEFKNSKAENEKEKEKLIQKQKEYEKYKRYGIICNVAIGIACIVLFLIFK